MAREVNVADLKNRSDSYTSCNKMWYASSLFLSKWMHAI